MPKKAPAKPKTDNIVFDETKLSVVLIDEVRPNTWNPKEADTVEYQRIKLGIQQHGLRKPIIVRENEGFEIIDGEQRWTICKELGYTKIPIYNEGELSDKQARELTIIYEQQVPFEPINFRVLIKELDDMYDSIDIGYSDIEIGDILKEIMPFQDNGVPKEEWINLLFTVPPDALSAITDELKRIGKILEINPRLPKEMREGLILEKICVLSGLTPTESLE